MVHFTMTGFYAGTPYCCTERNPDDEYQHPAYNREAYAAQLANPNLCPECKRMATED